MSLLLSLLCDPYFVILVFFEDPHFQWQTQSGTWEAPELKTRVYKTFLCLGDTWTVSPLASAPRASINPKPAPVAHLEFLTSPPKFSLLNLKGQSWSQQRKESTGASSLLGALSPEVFTLFSHTSTFNESCRRLSPPGPPWLSYTVSWGWALLCQQCFPVDFLVLCVRGFPGIFRGLPGAVFQTCLMSLMTKMSLRMSVTIFKKSLRGYFTFTEVEQSGPHKLLSSTPLSLIRCS